MIDLESLVEKNLELSENEERVFVVSLSGGVDSSVLASVVASLAKRFPIRLEFIHFNFQLRGRESSGDEKFVRSFAKKRGVKLRVVRLRPSKKSGTQESARAMRLEVAKKYPKVVEWIEAHHADDQIETVFLRFFRGTGLSGLTVMKKKSIRGGRLLWRPLLGIFKSDLFDYAKFHKIDHRSDSSNKLDKYDRNWVRLKLLPLIDARFPHARSGIMRTLENLQDVHESEETRVAKIVEQVILTKSPLELDWDSLLRLKPGIVRRSLKVVFNSLGINLDRRQLMELNQCIDSKRSFSWNAPRGWIVRGRQKSLSVPKAKVRIFALQR